MFVRGSSWQPVASAACFLKRRLIKVMDNSAQRVLLVEDEPAFLELLQSWTAQEGLQIRAASSVRDAWELCRSFKPDVLITDYFLDDELTGVDLIARIRTAGLKIRCVLITGALQSALLESLHRLHRVPILTKPFDAKRLRQLLRTDVNARAAGEHGARRRS